MKNRAKCRLCLSVVESFFEGDVCTCKCGEITVYDGSAMRVEFRNVENFLRIDDLGNEIIIKYKDKEEPKGNEPQEKQPFKEPTTGELIAELDRLIESYEKLPEHAKLAPVNCYDLISLMLVLTNILKRGS